MLPNINQAGQVPAETGDVKEDVRAIRRYLAGLVRQLDVILLEIDRELEARKNGKTS